MRTKADLFAGIAVSDYSRASEWYQRLFGSPPSFIPNESEAVWELAEHRFVFIERRPEHSGHARHLVFVNDLDAVVAEIAERGLVPAKRESLSNGVRKVRIRVSTTRHRARLAMRSPPRPRRCRLQWLKNLSQIVVLALIIVYCGVVSGELKSGTAVLMLTKPLSRRGFVVAKAVVHSVFLALLVVAGTLITWGLTAIIFGSAPGSALWSATMAWLALGILFVGLMTLLSTLIGSAAGAAGAGLGAYALLLIAAIWKPLGTYSPAALTAEVSSLASGKSVDVSWPVVTSLLVAAACVAIASQVIRYKDL